MHDPVERKDAAEGHRQHEEIERDVVLQRDQAEEIAAGHALDAVLAAGEFGLQREEIDHLRKGQRHHGEIDALPADRERADGQAQNRRRRRAAQHREFRREPPDLGGMSGDIACPAEIGRMSERQQPAEARAAG